MDWETLSCPNRTCRAYGVPFRQGWWVKNGTSHGQPQARCRACGRSVALSAGTASFELDREPALFETAIRAVAEGDALRSTARSVQSDQDTVCAWLHRAAQHCRRVMVSLWRALPVTECPLDELWRVVQTKEEHLEPAQRCCATSGDAWGWIACAPAWRLVLAFVVGTRTQNQANRLLERVVPVTDARIPFFTSDQLPEYRTALLQAYGAWEQPARRGDRGRDPARRRVPPPALLYAQVVKQRERGHVVAVTTKGVLGDAETVKTSWASSPTRTTIKTRFVERDTLTLRQQNRRLTRNTNGLSNELMGLEQQLWLSLASSHVVLPHESLRQALPMTEPTRGHGSPRRWHPVTPAMAAGLTDHVWSTSELLSYRVPPTWLENLSTIEHQFPALDLTHQGN